MEHEIRFPDPNLAEDDGLVAVGGELSTDHLLSAYSQGLFPWFNEGEPLLWWSPNPRMVLYPSNFKRSNSLKQTIRNGNFVIKIDHDFSSVMRSCSQVQRRNQTGTWISEEMIKAYKRLHDLGYAHSVETYLKDELVGGLYGISIGKVFFGESMFYHVRDASKVALSALCDLLMEWEFHFIDVQQSTSHLRSLGAKDLDRRVFLDALRGAINHPTKKFKWSAL